MAAVSVLLGAGCGRIAFDPSVPGDGVISDLAIDVRVIPPPPTSQADCPAGYTFILSSCYAYLDGVPRSWLDAELDCESVGAHLVVVDNAAEAVQVDMLPPGNIVDHWYGASDLVTTGTFLTVTAAPLVPMFDAGEPVAGRHCVQLLDNTRLDTADCGRLNAYVCEMDGIGADPGTF